LARAGEFRLLLSVPRRGPIEPFDIMLLMKKGSLFATWQLLFAHLARREDVLAMCEDLFDVVSSGATVRSCCRRSQLQQL
jgi:hypothetical protein